MANFLIDILVVAGGGSGGAWGDKGGAGGGAGGLINILNKPIALGATFPVTVGLGAVASNGQGNNGQNSIFSDLISIGGGGGGKGQPGGGNGPPYSGRDGGSGGGTAEGLSAGPGTPGLGIVGQGNNGGFYQTGFGAGGSGGGGAGAVGDSHNGGNGLSNNISGVPIDYAGGGAGGPAFNGSGGPFTGGIGGGGNYSAGVSTPGTPNTGGGGASGNHITTIGQSGGLGIVIISYVTGSQDGTGGIITQVGGRTIHTFLSSGTFIAPVETTVTELIISRTSLGANIQDHLTNDQKGINHGDVTNNVTTLEEIFYIRHGGTVTITDLKLHIENLQEILDWADTTSGDGLLLDSNNDDIFDTNFKTGLGDSLANAINIGDINPAEEKVIKIKIKVPGGELNEGIRNLDLMLNFDSLLF